MTIWDSIDGAEHSADESGALVRKLWGHLKIDSVSTTVTRVRLSGVGEEAQCLRDDLATPDEAKQCLLTGRKMCVFMGEMA